MKVIELVSDRVVTSPLVLYWLYTGEHAYPSVKEFEKVKEPSLAARTPQQSSKAGAGSSNVNLPEQRDLATEDS